MCPPPPRNPAIACRKGLATRRQPLKHRLRLCPRPPANPPPMGWRTLLENELFSSVCCALCVCLCPLLPRRVWGRGCAAALAPREHPQSGLGLLRMLLAPDLSKQMLQSEAGEGVGSHPNKPSPPNPRPGSSTGLTYRNDRIVLLWGCFSL